MTTSTTDIPSRVRDAASPSFAQRLSAAYELTKPRMNFLVVITTAVGFALAAGTAGLLGRPLLLLQVLFGTALTAAGASVLNMYVEREADKLMPRTRNRPLPARQLSAGFALASGVGLGLAGTLWLAAFVNPLTAGLGLFTLLSYVLVYTPLKRVTPLCTLVGAVPGAIPPMMGFTAFTGELSAGAWALFAVLFVWQMPHFFGLAMMYRDDYRRGGFAMLPTQTDGMRRTARQIVGFCLLMLPVGLLPFFAGVSGIFYAVASLVLGAWYLSAGLRCARTLARPDARRLFLVSILYLPLLLAAMMLNS